MPPRGTPESPATNATSELTPEQWAAGAEIADLVGFDDETLKQMMLWNGVSATVEYGLAHSAKYMDALTPEEIKKAVSAGISAYQASQGKPTGNR